MRHLLLLTSLLLATPVARAGDAPLPFHGDTHVRFATVEEARALLGTADAWVKALSPFDRQLRLKSKTPVDQARFLEFAAAQALAWDEPAIAATTTTVASVRARLAALDLGLDLPDEILLVRTTGKEEGNAGGYTRANAIIVPAGMAGAAEGFFLHELFHVMTRHAPEVRVPLYRLIGFEPCPPIEYPPALAARRITNPDAFHFDSAVEVTLGGETVHAMLVTLARSLPYERGGLFANISIEFLVVEPGPETTTVAHIDGRPALHRITAARGFYEKIGRNTQYIIHPEEIMADNFSYAILGRGGVANPEILGGVLECLRKR